MKFPKFLTIVSMPRMEAIKANGTISYNQVFDSSDNSLIDILSRRLGFSYRLVSPVDREFGRLLTDGNFTGMVGMVQRKEADIIMHKLAITLERSDVIDYSNPYYIDRMVFTTKNLESSVSATAFLKPFSFPVWMSLMACVVLLPVIHHLLFNRNSPLRNLLEFKLFTQMEDSASTGEYVFRSCWTIGEVFLRWCFTAVLLSSLTFPTLTGVRTVPELAAAIEEGSYECTTDPGGFIFDALVKAGGYLAVIGRNLKKRESGHTELLAGQAHIAPEDMIIKLKVSNFVSDDGFFPVLVSIGLRKGFCCKKDLDSFISKIWASGIYVKILQSTRYKDMFKLYQKSTHGADDDLQRKPLSIEDVDGIFIFLVGGYFLAMVVFVFEVMLGKCGMMKKLFCA